MNLVDQFTELFAGRHDAYGTEGGGCARLGNASMWTSVPYKAHLDGREPIGVYPMVPGKELALCRHSLPAPVDPDFHYVRWGCIDLDVKAPHKRRYDYETADDALVAARNLVTALDVLGITGWIERTKSGGYHVWVFADEWVPAFTMRRALQFVCQLVDVPPTEVNPKSETLHPDQLGNYVRLPYPGHLGEKADAYNRVMLIFERPDSMGPYQLGLETFVGEAMRSRVSLETLGAVADMYVPPLSAERTIELSGEVPECDSSITDKLHGLAWTIFQQGPSERGDRSGTLMRLAHLCHEDGLTPEEATAVLFAADLAWGKFIARGDEEQLHKMIERAYQ